VKPEGIVRAHERSAELFNHALQVFRIEERLDEF
jgi:hypothetical protein